MPVPAQPSLLIRASIAVAAIVALPLATFAALPPKYQRAAEMRRIAESGAVKRALKYQPIAAIQPFGNDRYEVRSVDCTAMVHVVDAPSKPSSGPPKLGARRFELRVEAPSCK
jgi:hypothetical protein